MEIKGAHLSDCEKYRYTLWRIWDDSMPMVNFIGLNPSIADAAIDDPTMRRCRNFAKDWGYGGFYMTNLFAYRSTFPDDLQKEAEPIGPENDRWILEIEQKVEKIIFAWGAYGTFKNRHIAVIKLIKNAHCIALTKNGHPKHPLYLRGDLTPQKFNNTYF